MYAKLIVLLVCIFPIFLIVACNYLVKQVTYLRKKKIKGMDIALPFLVLGIFLLTSQTYTMSYVPFYLLTVLLLGVVVAVVNVKFFSMLEFSRYIKMYWRILFMATLYIYAAFAIMQIINLVV